MRAPVIRPTLAILLLLLTACGRESRPENDSPPHRVTTETVPAEPLPVVVSKTLGPGTCEPVTGDVINRQGLHGAQVHTGSDREIMVLLDANDRLSYYRDMVPGRGGYTVRLDVASDSGSVLDRATAVVVNGRVETLRSRPELGPPDSLAAQVMARCGEAAVGR